jgi:glucose dehydrogenase
VACFIGAALASPLHAYDVETGKELWKGQLPAGASHADDVQGGHAMGDNTSWSRLGRRRERGSADAIVAFRLGK